MKHIRCFLNKPFPKILFPKQGVATFIFIKKKNFVFKNERKLVQIDDKKKNSA